MNTLRTTTENHKVAPLQRTKSFATSVIRPVWRKRKDAVTGFSLIEMLVYVAVVVLVSLAGVITYISLDDVLVRNETERAVNHSASVVLERIGRDIRQATGVDAPQSTFGASPSELTLTRGATTTNFEVVGNALMLSVNGVSQGPLTGDDVIVEDFVVHRYVGTTTELVRVALTLSGSSKAATTTRTYYTSGVMRGTYE